MQQEASVYRLMASEGSLLPTGHPPLWAPALGSRCWMGCQYPTGQAPLTTYSSSLTQLLCLGGDSTIPATQEGDG